MDKEKKRISKERWISTSKEPSLVKASIETNIQIAIEKSLKSLLKNPYFSSEEATNFVIETLSEIATDPNQRETLLSWFKKAKSEK